MMSFNTADGEQLDAPVGGYSIMVEFSPYSRTPERVFNAVSAMISAMQKLDNVLCSSIDGGLRASVVLEKVEPGSIKVFLRDILLSTDDDALKSGDWKKVVGSYLVHSKRRLLEWTNKDTASIGLPELAKEIQALASETDVKLLPDYAPPSVFELAAITSDIQNVKSSVPNSLITFEGDDKKQVVLNAMVTWSVAELSSFAIREKQSFSNMPMILIVRKPDYLGTTKWQFRHGKRPITASLQDFTWLERFQRRLVDVRPGDGLKCLVDIEYSYSFDNELVAESLTIKKVLDVLENQATQGSFLSAIETEPES